MNVVIVWDDLYCYQKLTEEMVLQRMSDSDGTLHLICCPELGDSMLIQHRRPRYICDYWGHV